MMPRKASRMLCEEKTSLTTLRGSICYKKHWGLNIRNTFTRHWFWVATVKSYPNTMTPKLWT
jgi:hypothetical protein